MKKQHNKNIENRKRTKWAFQTNYIKKIPLCAAILTGVLFFCFLAYSVITCLPYFQNHFLRAGVPTAEIISSSDSFNMLILTYGADGLPVQLMLYRLDNTKNVMVVMPIPLELKIEQNGAVQTISEELKHSGTGLTVSALEATAHIKIGYYCVVSADNLAKVMDLFGSFNYTVSKDISCTLPGSGRTVNIQSGSNTIDSTKAIALMSGTGYNNLSERYGAQAGLMKAFVSQKLTGYYMDHAESLFKSLFNVVRINFSYNDLITRLNTIKTVSERSNFVTSLVPSVKDVSQGETTMMNFDDKTIEQIKNNF